MKVDIFFELKHSFEYKKYKNKKIKKSKKRSETTNEYEKKTKIHIIIYNMHVYNEIQARKPNGPILYLYNSGEQSA